MAAKVRVFPNAGLLGKLAAAVKVAVTARLFGAGSDLDAYLIAFPLASFLAEVFAGSIRSALVPTLVRTEPEKARMLSQDVLSAAAALLCALAILIVAVS